MRVGGVASASAGASPFGSTLRRRKFERSSVTNKDLTHRLLTARQLIKQRAIAGRKLAAVMNPKLEVAGITPTQKGALADLQILSSKAGCGPR